MPAHSSVSGEELFADWLTRGTCCGWAARGTWLGTHLSSMPPAATSAAVTKA